MMILQKNAIRQEPVWTVHWQKENEADLKKQDDNTTWYLAKDAKSTKEDARDSGIELSCAEKCDILYFSSGSA